MREPMLPELQWLRAQLSDHIDKPLPRELHVVLGRLITWAGWKITGPSTLDQTLYQRYSLMLEGRELAARKGLKTGLWKDARTHAMKMAAGSYAECGDEMMRKSYEDMRDATYE
jgi:hypothetical protein